MLGGGLLVDLAKYDDLDKAQEQVEQLQEDLPRFKTELTDVTVEAELQVSIDAFSNSRISSSTDCLPIWR